MNGPARPPAGPAATLADRADVLLAATCPRCGEARPQESLTVEGWEDTGLTLGGRQTWTIRTLEIPGYCRECTKSLTTRRLLATALAALPLWLCAFGLGFQWGRGGLVILGILYAGFLLKRIGYTWADWLLYGMELEMQLATRVAPVRNGDASVRFPLGCLSSLFRLGFIAGGTVLLLFAGDLARMSGASGAPEAPGSTVPAGVSTPGTPDRSAGTFEDALRAGDLAAVTAFLDRDPSLLRTTGSKGERPLHLAVEADNPELVAFLVRRGAGLEDRDKGPGSTPLHRAAIHGKPLAAKALLQAGAQLEATRTRDRVTPLHLAVLNDKPEVVRVLLEAGANRNTPLPGGTKLLDAARKNNCTKVLPLLQER